MLSGVDIYIPYTLCKVFLLLCILYEIALTFGVYLYYFVLIYVRRLEITLYQALLKMRCIIIIIWMKKYAISSR